MKPTTRRKTLPARRRAGADAKVRERYADIYKNNLRVLWVPAKLSKSEREMVQALNTRAEKEAGGVPVAAMPGDDAVWVTQLFRHGPEAVRLALVEILEAGELDKSVNAFSALINAVSRNLKRELYGEWLRRADWDLAALAKYARMGDDGSPLIREIKKLGGDLADEYQKAKAAGKIVRGGRRAAPTLPTK